MKLTMWKTIPGFKIRRKADIHFFLDKVCSPNNRYVVKVRPDKVLFIEKAKDGSIAVRIKLGDIYNIFNPEFTIYDEAIKNEIWADRKAVNAYFFGDN